MDQRTRHALLLLASVVGCGGQPTPSPALPDSCPDRVVERAALDGYISLAAEQLRVHDYSAHDLTDSDGRVDNLVDARGATVWRAPAERAWVVIDLGADHAVTGIALQRVSFRHRDAPVRVAIEVSDDGQCFGESVAESALDEPYQVIEIDGAARGRFVRASFEARPGQGSLAVADIDVRVHSSLSTRAPPFAVAGRELVLETEITGPRGLDALTYSLASAPRGAEIDPSTGEIRWTPADSDLGLARFSIEATGYGAADLRSEIAVPIAVHHSILVESFDQQGADLVVAGSGTALDGTVISVPPDPARASAQLELGWLEFAPDAEPRSDVDLALAPAFEISTSSDDPVPLDVLFPETTRQWLDVEGARATVDSTTIDLDGTTVLAPLADIPREGPARVEADGRRVFIPTSGCSAETTAGDVTVDWQFAPVDGACPAEEARERAIVELARILGDVVSVFRNSGCNTPPTLEMRIRRVARGHFNPQNGSMEMEANQLDDLVRTGSFPEEKLVRFIHEVAHWVQWSYWQRAEASYQWESLADLMVRDYFRFDPPIVQFPPSAQLTRATPEFLGTSGSALLSGTSSYHLYSLFRYLQDHHQFPRACDFYNAQAGLLANQMLDAALHAQVSDYGRAYARFVSAFNHLRDKTQSFDDINFRFNLPVQALELRGTQVSLRDNLGGGVTAAYRSTTTRESFELVSQAPDHVRYSGHLWFADEDAPALWFDQDTPNREIDIDPNREFVITVARTDGPERRRYALVTVVLRRGDLTTVVGTVDDDYFSDPALVELTIPGTTYRRLGTADENGEFRIEQVPATLGPIVARAMCWEGNEQVGTSPPTDPVARGETYVGIIDLPDDCGFECKDLCAPDERDGCPWVPCPQSGQCAHITWFCDGISAGHCGLPNEDERQCYDGRACNRLVVGGPARVGCANWCSSLGFYAADCHD